MIPAIYYRCPWYAIQRLLFCFFCEDWKTHYWDGEWICQDHEKHGETSELIELLKAIEL